ncbi:MAG: hypothetical protein M3R43_09825 [Acidobacteriota bacterium]|nr:hypothetical protein [Acidobacteriota bacterium]
MTAHSLSPAVLVVALLSGCHGTSSPHARTSVKAEAQQRDQVESQRQELELIPPPSKSRYLAVHSLDAWENPYLTIQAGMVTIHVMIADANPTNIGVGGLMRPVNARRENLNVTLDKLGDALRAVPRSSWPYGRVAAVEEAHKIPAGARPQVRRTTEVAMKTLGDLGIVVYEWNETGPGVK